MKVSVHSITPFKLPFRETWLTFWGGDTLALNRHHQSTTEKYAFDFVIVDSDGQSHTNDGWQNKHYYAFGKDILAPADGVVMEVVDGVRDNTPGETNPYVLPGNHVLIFHSEGVYSFLAHLRQGSIVVKEGQRVIAGQKLGACGNSGNSSEPHVHYHLQNNFVYSRFIDGKLTSISQGIKVHFKDIALYKNGEKTIQKLYSPIKGNLVSNSLE